MRSTPALLSSAAKRLQLAAVGRQRQLLEGAGLEVPRQRSEQPHDVLAHERLAAGDAQLADAAADEGRADAVELLERQQLAARQELMCSDMQ